MAAAFGLLAFPSLPLVNNFNIPPGNPLPGTLGGGALPATASPELLALVPAGLTAVSVFPPFATPRTVEAEAVIFRESNVNRRVKRQTAVKSIKHAVERYIRGFTARFMKRRRYPYYYKRRSLWDTIKSGNDALYSTFNNTGVVI